MKGSYGRTWPFQQIVSHRLDLTISHFAIMKDIQKQLPHYQSIGLELWTRCICSPAIGTRFNAKLSRKSASCPTQGARGFKEGAATSSQGFLL